MGSRDDNLSRTRSDRDSARRAERSQPFRLAPKINGFIECLREAMARDVCLPF